MTVIAASRVSQETKVENRALLLTYVCCGGSLQQRLVLLLLDDGVSLAASSVSSKGQMKD